MRTIWEAIKQAFRGLRVGREQRLLVGQSIIIGFVVWIAIFALKEIVHWLFHEVIHWIEYAPTVFVLFIPLVVGALIVALIGRYRSQVITYRDAEGEIEPLNAVEGDGVERAIALYYSSDSSVAQGMVTGEKGIAARWQVPTFALGIRKFLATLATLGSGGSGGLEGSSVLIGETIGAGIYKFRNRASPSDSEDDLDAWKFPNTDHLQVAQLSAVAAAVSVLLGAPLAAAFFATEVMYRNKPLLQKLFYALVAALVARVLSSYVKGARPLIFHIEELTLPEVSLRYLLYLFLVAIAIAFVGQVYRALTVQANSWFQKGISNHYARLALGAVLTGTIAVLFYFYTTATGVTEHGLEFVLGSGEPAIGFALAGEITLSLALIALVAKMFATLATIGSGGSAGMLVPALFFGTMVAAMFADLADLTPVTLIAPAMAASLIALVNTPLAAILLAIELFGVEYMVPVLLALIVTGLFSNPKTIYRTQQNAPVDDEEVELREVPIPVSWQGKTLDELQLNKRHGLQIVGLLEQEGEDGRAHVRVDDAAAILLESGDVLVVAAEIGVLDAFEIAVSEG